MLKTAGFAFRGLRHRDPGHCLVAADAESTAANPVVETIAPETLPHGRLSELKFTDMTFVFPSAN